MDNVELLKTFALLGSQVKAAAKAMLYLCRRRGIEINEQSLLLFVYQNISSAQQLTKTQKYSPLMTASLRDEPVIQSDENISKLNQQLFCSKTVLGFQQYVTAKDCVAKHSHVDVPLKDVLKNLMAILNDCKEPQVPYSWDAQPCHMYIDTVLEPLKLDLAPRIVHGIADQLTSLLAKTMVPPLSFLSMQSSDCHNFILDVIFCRKDLNTAFEGSRLNIFYINPAIFQTQIDRVNQFEQQEQSHQKFSTFVSCPKCKQYMIKMRPIQTAIGLDECTRWKAQCHSQSCGHQFITK